MNRDGAHESIWQHNMPEYIPHNSWNSEEVYDVLIIGGGITGITTAYLLQQAGRRCILAEAHNIGFGTTGGTTAHLNTMLDTTYSDIEENFGAEEAQMVAQAARSAIDLIEKHVNELQIDCTFEYAPAFLFSETEEETRQMDEIMEAAIRAGLHVSETASLPFNTSFLKAYRIESQAKFHPVKYITALAQAFEMAGGVILQHCPVKDTPLKDEVFHAETSLGAIQARDIVFATHTAPGINLLSFRCAPYRTYVAAFKPTSGAFDGGLVYDMKEPYHYFRKQIIDGEAYVIAGGFDHKTAHKDNQEYVFTELEAYLRHHFEFDKIDYKWSSQYFTNTDGLPYIGLLPGYDNVYVATGFAGNGMIFGTLSGMIISDLILQRDNYYASLLTPSRIKPIAGFTEFVRENADVVKQFITGRFDYEAISQMAELAPDEGKLVIYENEKIGVYKDENGLVTAVHPVCTHAGCTVAWNNAEKSWDCPCHGGRYAPNGTVITGPPVNNLELLQWKKMDGD